MARKFLLILLLLVTASASYAANLIDRSKVNVPSVNDMSMGDKVLPNYTGTGTFIEVETPGFNLTRMKEMNPDFTTYPEANGIIWHKKVTYERSKSGGIDITRLYVILGRRGLSSKWLTWNIQTPAKGSAEILNA